MKMMKRKWMSLLAALALLTLTLCGCGGSTSCAPEAEDPGKDAVCYILGRTANARELNLNTPIVCQTAQEVIENYGYVGLVQADGSPELVFHKSYEIPEQYKHAAPEKLKSDARVRCTELLLTMQNVRAVTPEVDYLQALWIASRSFTALTDCRSKTIIFVGTGLSTTGTLNFRNNLFAASPEAVVQMLAERQEIPDFSNCTVIFLQLGEVASPQEPLSKAQRVWLQELYRGIVTSGGGSFVLCDAVSTPADPDLELPEVSVISLPEEPVIGFSESIGESAVIVEEAEALFSSPVSLGEKEIRFIPDTASFASPEDAIHILQPLADSMQENPGITLLLAGCIAGDNCSAGGVTLSRQRAEAVKDALESLNVPEERLIAVGLGSEAPWQIRGAGYDGPLAAENRRVVLMDAGTDTARQLLALSESLTPAG